MTARFSSASAYMQDAFLFAFLLLFFESGTGFPLAMIWLALAFLTFVVAMMVSWRKPYKPVPVLLAAAAVMALSIAAGVTAGTFIVLTVFSLYRLHARFSEIEDSNSEESRFVIFFLLAFTAALIFSLLNPESDPENLLLPLAAGAIIFYTISRLLYRYFDAKHEGVKLGHAIFAAAGISAVAGIGGFIVYILADESRQLAGSIVGGILAIILWPFAGILDWLVNLVTSLTSEEDMEANRDKLEPSEEQTELMQYTGGVEFDYTTVAGIAVLLLVIVGIFLIRRIKPEISVAKDEPVAYLSRFAAGAEIVEDPEPARTYSLVDIHELRLVYRDFESIAVRHEKGRMNHETVREWAGREELPFTESFFRTYDKVRYSDGQIANNEAEPFLQELEKIKEEFIEKDV